MAQEQDNARCAALTPADAKFSRYRPEGRFQCRLQGGHKSHHIAQLAPSIYWSWSDDGKVRASIGLTGPWGTDASRATLCSTILGDGRHCPSGTVLWTEEADATVRTSQKVNIRLSRWLKWQRQDSPSDGIGWPLL